MKAYLVAVFAALLFGFGSIASAYTFDVCVDGLVNMQWNKKSLPCQRLSCSCGCEDSKQRCRCLDENAAVKCNEGCDCKEENANCLCVVKCACGK